MGILIFGPLMVMGASVATEGHVSGTVAALLAFLVPVVPLIVVLTSKNEQQRAVESESEEYGAYRKCPLCAESIRLEAAKCKHCGSALEPVQADASSKNQT